MTRRRLFAFILPAALPAQKPNKKWYITGLPGGDCKNKPIVSYGADRIEALVNMGAGNAVTVWSAEEWEAANTPEFQKQMETGCKAQTIYDKKLATGWKPTPGVHYTVNDKGEVIPQ